MGKGSIFQRKRLRVVNLRPNDVHSPELVTMCPFARFQLNAEVLVAATSLPTNGPERKRLGLGLGSSHHHGDQSSLDRSRDGRFPGVWRGWSWSGSPCRQRPPCLAHFLLPQPGSFCQFCSFLRFPTRALGAKGLRGRPSNGNFPPTLQWLCDVGRVHTL